MSKRAKGQSELAKVMAMERRLANEYSFNQQYHRQQILRKEHENSHFVQSLSWKTDGHLLKYQ